MTLYLNIYLPILKDWKYKIDIKFLMNLKCRKLNKLSRTLKKNVLFTQILIPLVSIWWKAIKTELRSLTIDCITKKLPKDKIKKKNQKSSIIAYIHISLKSIRNRRFWLKLKCNQGFIIEIKRKILLMLYFVILFSSFFYS